MKSKLAIAIATISLVVIGINALYAEAHDKYTAKVPGGLAFSEFRGYESWETIAISHKETAMDAIVGNPAMIEAYRVGIPGNGKPFPDGAMMAKLIWTSKKTVLPGSPWVPDALAKVDFMVKDSRRFADSGGWGYAVFDYDPASQTFTPGTMAGSPPQGNDAKCGFACHTIAKSKDYVFTEYAAR